MVTPSDMAVGATHDTNINGKLEIIEYINSKRIKVMFIDTGFKTNTGAVSIRNGKVKDKLLPSVFGVGFTGDGKYSKTKDLKCYQTWSAMIERSYCCKFQDKSPTYIGCSVNEEWHNFQNFAPWFYKNYIKGYQLDKDKLIKGNKVYSAKTCCFLSPQENSEVSKSKHYTMCNPQGDIVNIFNMHKFCRENNLSQPNMAAVAAGRRKSHKGYRLQGAK